MPRRERLKDYRVPRTGGLRRRLLWRLRRMRHAVDVELGLKASSLSAAISGDSG